MTTRKSQKNKRKNQKKRQKEKEKSDTIKTIEDATMSTTPPTLTPTLPTTQTATTQITTTIPTPLITTPITIPMTPTPAPVITTPITIPMTPAPAPLQILTPTTTTLVSAPPNTTTLCLTMIVKNESKIILRCLSAALPICNYMTICDTGSTDDTCGIVERFFADNVEKIKGTLFHHEWKNFGHNRTLSLEVARATGATYMLCLDADMILQVLDFNPEQLTKDVYHIAQRNSTLYYFNTRIMRCALPWKCVGVTHEYYACDNDGTGKPVGYPTQLHSLIIDDVGDGGSKADKFERDIRLLTAGLVDEPENIRYLFYLAESYRNSGRYDEAILWYTQRTKHRGFDEEVFMAKYMIGKCHQEKKDWPRALDAYLEAYSHRPTRAEPLYQIAKYYRETSKHLLCMQFCQIGVKIEFPKDTLFVNVPVYSYQFLWEMCIVAYYLKKYELGLMACEKLLHGSFPAQDKLQKRGLPNWMVSGVEQNRMFYLNSLETYGPVYYQQILISTPEKWLCCNPCIILSNTKNNDAKAGNSANPSDAKANDTQYTLLVRSVNYILNPADGTYQYPFGNVDTTTYVLQLKAEEIGPLSNQSPITRQEIAPQIEMLPHDPPVISESSYPMYYPAFVIGFEDVRIVRDGQGQLWGFATSKKTSPDNLCEIVMLQLEENRAPEEKQKGEASKISENLIAKRILRLRGYEDKRHQKNWMPFIHEGRVLIVYSCDPLVILQPDMETGQCTVITKLGNNKNGLKWSMSGYRGSSQGVPFDGGYLFVVHEVIVKGKSRKYIHRFILITPPNNTESPNATTNNATFNITKISQPFYFKQKTVEFVSGMCIDPSGEFVCMTMGYEDKQAWLVKTETLFIRKWLQHGDQM